MIADDHLILRTGLRSIIEMQRDMEVAAEAVNGQEAVDLFFKEEPDVMLLDLRASWDCRFLRATLQTSG